MSAPPLLFDRARLRRLLDRAAATMAQADFLRVRVAEDLVWRLEGIMRDFPLAVDLGARGGAFARALAASPAGDRVGTLVEADLSPRLLGGRPAVVLDEERLPFAPASLDLVVSGLALHVVNDLPGALTQIRRALKPDGLFLAAMLAGDTLCELRRALLEAETEVRGGAGARVAPFADPRDAAGLLQRAGFALPAADVDRITVRYASPLKLLADLRRMGERAALADRPAAPLTREVLARACAAYARDAAEPDGRVSATFEIVTLTGWAPHASQPHALTPGSARTRLADAVKASVVVES